MKVTELNKSVNRNQNYLLHCAFEAAQQNQAAIAVWRLPKETTQHCMVDFTNDLHPQELDLEESPQGFAISPFFNPECKKVYFIKSEWTFTTDIPYTPDKSAEVYHPKAKAFFETLHKQLAETPEKKVAPSLSFSFTKEAEQAYKELVKKAVEEIANGTFRKVVTSRKQEVNLNTPVSCAALFNKLCEAYPNAFVSLFHLPGIGTWLGATPEILVSIDKDQIFKTMALAGTQAYNPDKPISEAVWTQKEIEEQALVSRYIINCFKKIRVREFEEEGPKTVRAGNLLHLRTDFWANIQEISYPQMGSVMMRLLHPTSAVCGMPKETSQQFILNNENYDRQFYSGFLGPVNYDSASHLFVNLRCMQILDQQLFLYAGGGITIDSNPDKEWQETVMKCETMLKVLEK